MITAAIVGAEVMREHTPHIPYTPVEIAAEAARCRDAGACIAHVHGRTADGTPTQAREVFAEILAEIRQRTDILVQFSTGGAVGMSPDERIEALDLRPDMATLTTGSVNFGDEVFLNDLPTVRRIATRLQELGIKPEIEVFEAGMLETAKRLVQDGLLTEPLHVDFVLGVPGAMGGHEDNLTFLRSQLPSKSTWSVAGVGRYELPLAAQAIAHGGHVRVGLEDNIYLSKGVLAKGSYELVALVANIGREHGREPASPEEARALLSMKDK
ncbi:MAG: 3-keto-5-aminohexanoate cleavage protein [Myxococcota bacterium]